MSVVFNVSVKIYLYYLILILRNLILIVYVNKLCKNVLKEVVN